jgi:threonine dehydratase
VVLKLEGMQVSGSFKARGAFNALLQRPAGVEAVTAASGGNHGAAVATAAAALGLRAEIFVPAISSPAKVALIQGTGATVVQGGATYADALAAMMERQRETGALSVHAYDQAETLAGQGTVAMEFFEDAPEITHVLVATGGGGLIGGMAAWARGEVAIVSVEPEGCPALHDALAAGAPVDARVGGIAADSLGARRVGDLMFGWRGISWAGRCWCPTRRSGRRSGGCGARRGWWPNPAARRRWPRSSAGRGCRRTVPASACWCAGRIATRRRWPDPSHHSSQLTRRG